MEVKEVEQHEVPRPDTVYITPPNRNLLFRDGHFELVEPIPNVAPKPSVNSFFYSVAAERGEDVIGVILSGTGSDGAGGVRAIKAGGGLVFAQDPASAKYDGMPQSAIETDCVDWVFTPVAIARQIAIIVRTQGLVDPPEKLRDAPGTIQSLLTRVQRYTRIDFSGYKENTVWRRILRRMATNRVESLQDYIEGFLPQQYMKGRRASYLNPVKKYVFTSAIFFLLFFSFFLKKDTISINISGPVSADDKVLIKKFVEDELAKDTGSVVWQGALLTVNDTTKVLKYTYVTSFWTKSSTMRFGNKVYKGLAHYDSVQKVLPSAEKDGWLKRIAIRKALQVNEKYKDDPRTGFNKLRDSVFHKLPYLLFVSLPLFALILKLLYFRHKDLY